MGKNKMEREFAEKKKKQQTKEAIAHSAAVNKQRLAKVNQQHAVLAKITDEAKVSLGNQLSDKQVKQDFLAELIVQGLLVLLGEDVGICCLESDVEIVTAATPAAQKMYADAIKKQSGADKKCSLSVSSVRLNGLGGVVLECKNGAITIDNTIDARLRHVMDQAKPQIRKMLFVTK